MQRQLTAYELNELRQFGLESINLTELGEKPIEYITGHAHFYDLDFIVTPDVLIPRIESEKIVDIALEHVEKASLSHPTIADIGTGSGCLAISLAKTLSSLNHPYTIFLSDISTKALSVARSNSQKLLTSQTNLFFEESDLLKNYPHIKFDIIIANLPYIPSENIPKLPLSVRDYEPHSALDGGSLGITKINDLIKQIPEYLSEKGVAILEIDDTQTPKSFTIPETFSTTIVNDCFEKPRFLLLNLKQ